MSRRLFVALALLLPLAGLAAAADKELSFKVYGPYFEKNTSGLKGAASYLVFKDQAGFDKLFGSGRVMKQKPVLLAKDHFDKHLVVAVIKRGDQVVKYDVSKVTVDDGVVRVRYKAEAQGKPGGTAKFASPLVVGLPRGEYKSVEFVENGKAVETVKLGK